MAGKSERFGRAGRRNGRCRPNDDVLPRRPLRRAARRRGRREAVWRRPGAGRRVVLPWRRGELVGLLGPNGAGKTTAIRAIAGRVTLDAGTHPLVRPGARAGRSAPRCRAWCRRSWPSTACLRRGRTSRCSRGSTACRPPGCASASNGRSTGRGCAIAPTSRSAASPAGCSGASTSPAACCTRRSSCCSTSPPSASIRKAASASTRCSDALIREGLAIVLTTHHLEEAEQRCRAHRHHRPRPDRGRGHAGRARGDARWRPRAC